MSLERRIHWILTLVSAILRDNYPQTEPMMIFQSMNKSQQSQAADWALSPAQAITLNIGPGPRWLHLTQGRAWVTLSAAELDAASADTWLQRGDKLWVADGATLVIEAWPTARFELLVPPQACAARWTAADWMLRLAQSVGGIWPRRLKLHHVNQRHTAVGNRATAQLHGSC